MDADAVTYLGPSFVTIDNHEGGQEYNSCVWIGGDGSDERWGHNVQFTFTVERNNTVNATLLSMLLDRQKEALASMFGSQVGNLITMAIIESIVGTCLPHAMPLEVVHDRLSGRIHL